MSTITEFSGLLASLVCPATHEAWSGLYASLEKAAPEGAWPDAQHLLQKFWAQIREREEFGRTYGSVHDTHGLAAALATGLGWVRPHGLLDGSNLLAVLPLVLLEDLRVERTDADCPSHRGWTTWSGRSTADTAWVGAFNRLRTERHAHGWHAELHDGRLLLAMRPY